MDFKWRKTMYRSYQLWWDEELMMCAELQQKPGDLKWVLTLAYRVAPLGFDSDRVHFHTLEESKAYTEGLVRVLIIGGHHERN